MDTKGPVSRRSQGNSCIFEIIDAFSHSVVINPVPHISSKYAFQTLLHNWIPKFGPLQHLVTDRSTEYINQDGAHLGSFFNTNRFPRTPYFSWTNGFVDAQNRYLGTDLRSISKRPSTNLSFQNQM